MATSNAATGLAQIGATFSDATTMLVVGALNTVNSGGNSASVLKDPQMIQADLQHHWA
jgi:hypothetical protein